MSSYPGVTDCVFCGVDLIPTRSRGDPPIQLVDQKCPNCSFTVAVGYIDYPGVKFEVVAPIAAELRERDEEGDSCRRCTSVGRYVVLVSSGGAPVCYCSEHIRAHHARVLSEFATELEIDADALGS